MDNLGLFSILSISNLIEPSVCNFMNSLDSVKGSIIISQMRNKKRKEKVIGINLIL